jgi:hypothetical protein
MILRLLRAVTCDCYVLWRATLMCCDVRLLRAVTCDCYVLWRATPHQIQFKGSDFRTRQTTNGVRRSRNFLMSDWATQSNSLQMRLFVLTNGQGSKELFELHMSAEFGRLNNRGHYWANPLLFVSSMWIRLIWNEKKGKKEEEKIKGRETRHSWKEGYWNSNAHYMHDILNLLKPSGSFT